MSTAGSGWVEHGGLWHSGAAGNTRPSLGLSLCPGAILGPMHGASAFTAWLGSDRCPQEREGTRTYCSERCGGGRRESGWNCSFQTALAYAFIFVYMCLPIPWKI